MKWQQILVFMISGLLCLIVIVSCSDSPTDPADNNQENTVSDIDGNVYKTVTIGTQVWMAENLKVTHYSNGDLIPNVTGYSQWSNLTTGALCSYDNNDVNIATYGLLYNCYAVNDSRGIAPAGWRVPSDEEWKELEMYLGMSQSDADVSGDWRYRGMGWRGTDEGGKLKETGTTHWNSPNFGANNTSGFTALPGGSRYFDGTFYSMCLYGYWWSSTESSSDYAWYRSLGYDYSRVYRDDKYKQYGFSVRLVRD